MYLLLYAFWLILFGQVTLEICLLGLAVVAAVALFIAFYPYASGLEVSREWLARMNWFKNWMWY